MNATVKELFFKKLEIVVEVKSVGPNHGIEVFISENPAIGSAKSFPQGQLVVGGDNIIFDPYIHKNIFRGPSVSKIKRVNCESCCITRHFLLRFDEVGEALPIGV